MNAEWFTTCGMAPPEEHGRYRCTNCHSRALYAPGRLIQQLSTYCPNCGAEMFVKLPVKERVVIECGTVKEPVETVRGAINE